MTIDKTLAIIREAIEIEKFGHEYYNKLRMIVKDRRGQVVLSYLAKLEVDHMNWLEEEYERQLNSLEYMDEQPSEGIKLPAIEEIFVVDALPYMFDGTDHVKAMEYAVQLEIRSVEFYTKAMEYSDDQRTKDLFMKLADFEKDHIEILNKNIENLKKNGMWIKPDQEHSHE